MLLDSLGASRELAGLIATQNLEGHRGGAASLAILRHDLPLATLLQTNPETVAVSGQSSVFWLM